MTEILNYVLNRVYVQFAFQLGICISVFLIGKEKRERFALRMITGGIVFTMRQICRPGFLCGRSS